MTKNKPHLAFSGLTKRVYIVNGNEKEDVTDWIDNYCTKQKLNLPGIVSKRPFTIEDIRNKLSPMSNLIALLESDNPKAKRFIADEIEQCKFSIKYLSQAACDSEKGGEKSVCVDNEEMKWHNEPDIQTFGKK